MTKELSSDDVRSLIQALEFTRRNPLPGAGTGLWHIENINLANARLSGGGAGLDLKVGQGFGVVGLRRGSSPGASVKLIINGCETPFFGAGAIARGPITSLAAVREDGSPAIGTLRLLVLDSPFAEFKEAPEETFATASVPTNNDNSGSNRPTLITQGVSLEGITGVRTEVLTSAAARTITAGTVHYWFWDLVTGLWAQSPIVHTLITGANTQRVVTADDAITVSTGRIYAELRDYAEDSGTTPPTAKIIAWGLK